MTDGEAYGAGAALIEMRVRLDVAEIADAFERIADPDSTLEWRRILGVLVDLAARLASDLEAETRRPFTAWYGALRSEFNDPGTP